MNRAVLILLTTFVVANSTGCCLLDRVFCGTCRPHLGCNRFHGCNEPPSNCGGCCEDGGCSTGKCGGFGGTRPLFSSGCRSCGIGSHIGGCRTCGGGFGGHAFAPGCRSCGGGRAFGGGFAGHGGHGGGYGGGGYGANPYGGGYANGPREGYNVGNPYGTAMGGPPTAQVAYPYYTTRGPRDFLANNPGYPSN